jgi:dTDP-4-dehydrorhamnose reductase
MRILITGSTGLIGTRITELLGEKYTFIPLLQSESDITDKVSVDSRLSTVDFDLLLHLAAYTNVDGAEKERELCHKINVDGTRHLFEMCERKKAKMIHISTDFVFDGKMVNGELRDSLGKDKKSRNVLSGLRQGDASNGNMRSDFDVGAEAPCEIPTYTERSIPNPISYYGQTKYEAEQIVKGQAMLLARLAVRSSDRG